MGVMAYDVALERSTVLLPSDEYVLPSGDRDEWSEITLVGRVHEEFVTPVAPIHKRPAVRIDTDDRPSIGNHIVDIGAYIGDVLCKAFDAIAETDLAGDALERMWYWLTHTYAGLLIVIVMGVVVFDIFTFLLIFWAPYHHGG